MVVDKSIKESNRFLADHKFSYRVLIYQSHSVYMGYS